MSKTIMYQEALSAPTKVAEQLQYNAKIWQEICTYLKEHQPAFAATVARGSSDHAATYAKYLLESKMGLITASIAPSIYTIYQSQTAVANSLFLGISQSGKSPDLVQSFLSVKNQATTVALVNVEGSPLANAARFVVPLLAGEEKAVAATKSYICALTALAQFIAIYTEDRVLQEALNALPEYLSLAANLDWQVVIDALKDEQDAYVIGRGYGYAIAQEAALKLKETACLHSEPFSSAEVLHGPFALIKKTFPTLVFAQNDASAKGTIELAQKMHQMGANVMFAMPGTQHVDTTHNLKTTKSLHPLLDPILLIQSFYTMAAKLATERGLNPDQPENLNKVTQTV
ncbi:MAG: SIS domain-containing protein [Proteobacteria bacterium]|nr:SIS domain-containing protein [Pseudomonadota bacterium]